MVTSPGLSLKRRDLFLFGEMLLKDTYTDMYRLDWAFRAISNPGKGGVKLYVKFWGHGKRDIRVLQSVQELWTSPK